MFQKEQAVSRLIEILVEYIPNLKAQIDDFSKDYFAQRALLRGLMNMHSEKIHYLRCSFLYKMNCFNKSS